MTSLLRGRVYGHDPHPGPRPHQRYAARVGGPLDGPLLDITGWLPEEVDDGVALSPRALAVARRPGAVRPAPR